MSDHETKPWKDGELVKRLYVKRGLSTSEIGEKLGCSQATAARWVKRHGITPRKFCNDLTRPAPFQTQKRGHELWSSKCGDKKDVVYVHQLLAIAEGEDPAKVFSKGDYHIHHKNHIPWDNRPENIELVTSSQHNDIHWEIEHGGLPWRDKELFEQMYESNSAEELAEIWGCCMRTISRWREKHGIERHEPWGVTDV